MNDVSVSSEEKQKLVNIPRETILMVKEEAAAVALRAAHFLIAAAVLI
jgi:hypothetical protein